MRATWDSRISRLEVEGRHKRGTPRVWTIAVNAYKGNERLQMTVRPRGKVLLTALDKIVRDELREFAPEWVTFTAVAR